MDYNAVLALLRIVLVTLRMATLTRATTNAVGLNNRDLPLNNATYDTHNEGQGIEWEVFVFITGIV